MLLFLEQNFGSCISETGEPLLAIDFQKLFDAIRETFPTIIGEQVLKSGYIDLFWDSLYAKLQEILVGYNSKNVISFKALEEFVVNGGGTLEAAMATLGAEIVPVGPRTLEDHTINETIIEEITILRELLENKRVQLKENEQTLRQR